MIMCVIIADIYLVPCAKASENGRFISTECVNSVCLSWGHGRALFPVAYCLVLSGHNQSLRLQRTQPIPSSMSLLRELAPLPSHPCTCGVGPSLDSLREEASGLSPQPPHTFPLLTQTQISCRVFEGEWDGQCHYQEQTDSVLLCCTWRSFLLLCQVWAELPAHWARSLGDQRDGSVVSVLLCSFSFFKVDHCFYLFVLLIFWSIIDLKYCFRYTAVIQLYTYIYDLYIFVYLLSFILFPITGYYKLLSIVPCAK